MTPIGRVFWGFLVVIVDVRIDGLDVVPDPVGWLLVVSGCLPLARTNAFFGGAAATAACALVVSVPDVFAENEALLDLVQSVLEPAVVFCVCTALVQVVGGRVGRSANVVRWIELGLLAIAAVASLADVEREVRGDGAVAAVALLVVVALAVAVWFLVILLRVRHHPALARDVALSPEA